MWSCTTGTCLHFSTPRPLSVKPDVKQSNDLDASLGSLMRENGRNGVYLWKLTFQSHHPKSSSVPIIGITFMIAWKLDRKHDSVAKSSILLLLKQLLNDSRSSRKSSVDVHIQNLLPAFSIRKLPCCTEAPTVIVDLETNNMFITLHGCRTWLSGQSASHSAANPSSSSCHYVMLLILFFFVFKVIHLCPVL